MGEERQSTPSTKSSTISRKRLVVIVVTVAVILAISIPVAFAYAEPGHRLPWEFHPYVYYSYAVAISPPSTDEFTVLCPFPANAQGQIAEHALQGLRVTGNATATNTSTEYGMALNVTGTGLVMLTWGSRAELPGPWEGYKDFRYLTLLGSQGYGSTANVFSGTAGVLLDLRFDFNHVYGNTGADFINYEIVTSLGPGWSSQHVDYHHAVA